MSQALKGYSLRFLGDPVLKKVSEEVKSSEFGSPELKDLVGAMELILATEKGAGLAAQQVGSTKRVALLKLSPHGRRETVVVAINLRITECSPTAFINNGEGCLSVQGKGRLFRTSVERHSWVNVSYQDGTGRNFYEHLEGFDSIVAQHEADHLDGKCIVDGLSRQQRRQAERRVEKK